MRVFDILELLSSTDSCTCNLDLQEEQERHAQALIEEERVKHHSQFASTLPAVYQEEQTFNNDDQVLLEYALNRRDVLEAPQINVEQRQSVFCEGLKLARMKTIMNLMTRLNVVEEHMVDTTTLGSADLKELAHAHRQLKDALALHLDAFDTSKKETPNVTFQANFQNNDNSHTEITNNLQAVIEDPQKRRRVMSTFTELLKTASHD